MHRLGSEVNAPIRMQIVPNSITGLFVCVVNFEFYVLFHSFKIRLNLPTNVKYSYKWRKFI